MNPYSYKPGLRARQIAFDATALFWVLLWVWLAQEVYFLIDKLAGVGRAFQDASAQVDDNASQIPSVFSPVADGLGSVAGALNSAGTTQVDAVSGLALLLALLVAVPAVVPPLSWYLFKRIRWIWAERSVELLRQSPNFEKLLAQRALMTRPLDELAKVSSDPIGDYSRGRYEALVQLEDGSRRFFPW